MDVFVCVGIYNFFMIMVMGILVIKRIIVEICMGVSWEDCGVIL